MPTSKTSPQLNAMPRHVAIIMDGNGRWAQARGLNRSAGHVEGVNTVERITELAGNYGIEYLTLYAFSTENWNRPQQEVDMLMHLMATVVEQQTPKLIQNNVRLSMIGDTARIPEDARHRMEACMKRTEHCTGLSLVLAISYSARWELTQAAKRIAALAAAGELDPASITDSTVEQHLTTASMPDPDLLIRTGGDMRVSNFLLWQIAYSEIVVTDTFWPDFDKAEFDNALAQYAGRQRRFGLTGEQVTESQTAQS